MSGYTDFWSRKMHKIFCLMDTKKLGYITEDILWEQYKHAHAAYPQLESQWKEQHQHSWKHFFNNGKDVPKDYKLTEEEFLSNMWNTVQQPDFGDMIEKMAEDSFGKLDMQHKGYVTKEEYLKIIVPALGEERSSALFDAMDTNHNGKLTLKELARAKEFFYTDVSDESNPINFMHGPLCE